MPRRTLPSESSRSRRDHTAKDRRGFGRRIAFLITTALVAVVALGVCIWMFTQPARHRARAETASAREDWAEAARAWGAYNRDGRADPQSLWAEARALLALGRAGAAERVLTRASELDQAAPDPYLLRLELLRLEGRMAEAARLGDQAMRSVRASSRRPVLRALTLALLADAPDDLARRTLSRWVDADPNDVDARVALLRRAAADPHAGDPDRLARIATLETLLASAPNHLGIREALVIELIESGDPDHGRALLDSWPRDGRDARYERLRGRWDLEHDRQPARAAEAFRRALAELPHDLTTRYQLARALRAAGLVNEAKAASESVAQLAEVLSPAKLGPRLDADLAKLDDPAARRDLADLCARVGLKRLADAWRDLDAGTPLSPSRGSAMSK